MGENRGRMGNDGLKMPGFFNVSPTK
ncbi:unnamed protein product [Ectocarpus sp. CCAP 1310/34]|nr:unnamed protein product [Ectocarpus sp. CCAP 1310/34]